jgi:hypothetical protein
VLPNLPIMSKFNHKLFCHQPIFAVPQPYYLKHVPMNPYFGCQHDGITSEWQKGFSVKPIHWIYRFRHNTTPLGCPPLYLRNPPGKDVHWLEVSIFDKFKIQCYNSEAWPHTVTAMASICIVAWQFSWSLWAHPELSLINIVLAPMKHVIMRERFNEQVPLDKPVFRWFQRAPEFYAYDTYRELIDMKIIANDPYIDWAKSVGRERELTLYMTEKGWGEGGQGKLVQQLVADGKKKRKAEANKGSIDKHAEHGDDGHGHH